MTPTPTLAPPLRFGEAMPAPREAPRRVTPLRSVPPAGKPLSPSHGQKVITPPGADVPLPELADADPPVVPDGVDVPTPPKPPKPKLRLGTPAAPEKGMRVSPVLTGRKAAALAEKQRRALLVGIDAPPATGFQPLPESKWPPKIEVADTPAHKPITPELMPAGSRREAPASASAGVKPRGPVTLLPPPSRLPATGPTLAPPSSPTRPRDVPGVELQPPVPLTLPAPTLAESPAAPKLLPAEGRRPVVPRPSLPAYERSILTAPSPASAGVYPPALSAEEIERLAPSPVPDPPAVSVHRIEAARQAGLRSVATIQATRPDDARTLAPEILPSRVPATGAGVPDTSTMPASPAATNTTATGAAQGSTVHTLTINAQPPTPTLPGVAASAPALSAPALPTTITPVAATRPTPPTLTRGHEMLAWLLLSSLLAPPLEREQ